MAPIQTTLFTQEGLDLFRDAFLKALTERQRAIATDQAKTKARLAEVEKEIGHIMVAIKAGTFFPTLRQALEKAEPERTRLAHTLDAPAKPNGTLPALLPDLKVWFKRAVGDIAKMGPHQIDKARGIIKDLVSSITLKPSTQGGESVLVAHLRPDYEGLARQLVGPKIILTTVFRSEVQYG